VRSHFANVNNIHTCSAVLPSTEEYMFGLVDTGAGINLVDSPDWLQSLKKLKISLRTAGGKAAEQSIFESKTF